MEARHPERQRHRPTVGEPDDGPTSLGTELEVGEPDTLGVRAEPPEPASVERGRHPIGSGPIVPDEDPAGRPRKTDVGRLHGRHRAVALQVVGLDVVDDRNGRRQGQERLVVLVRFDHEQIGAAHPGIAAPFGHPPAGQPRGIETGPHQGSGGHHGGGGLPVGPGNGHAGGGADQTRQRFLPRDDRDAEPGGLQQLGVGCRYGGAGNDGPRRRHQRRSAPDHDLGASRDQVAHAGRVGVRPANPHPPAERDQGQRAHPGSTGPHEVEWPGIGLEKQVHP